MTVIETGTDGTILDPDAIWDDDEDPMDEAGHGTHTGSIIAADGALRGVAPGARLQPYRVLGPANWGTWDDVIAAFERAIDPNGDGDFSDRADIIAAITVPEKEETAA